MKYKVGDRVRSLLSRVEYTVTNLDKQGIIYTVSDRHVQVHFKADEIELVAPRFMPGDKVTWDRADRCPKDTHTVIATHKNQVWLERDRDKQTWFVHSDQLSLVVVEPKPGDIIEWTQPSDSRVSADVMATFTDGDMAYLVLRRVDASSFFIREKKLLPDLVIRVAGTP